VIRSHTELLLALLTFLCTSQQVMAQKNKSTRPVKIVYGSPQWNLDSLAPDSAFLFMRDKQTGKIAKIILDETAPDSSTFSGFFSLNWEGAESTQPEVFIPPQDLRGQSGVEKFNSMILQDKIARKPVVFRKEDDGQRVIDVYDTKDQAIRAYKAYQDSVELKKQQARAEQLLEKAQTDQATIDTAALAEKQRKLKEMELEASKREVERIRMEQQERLKAEQMRIQQQTLAVAERAKRKREAQKNVKQGLKFYQAAEFEKALPLFQKAIELDPENGVVYLKYAITQYRLEMFNEAMVTMKITPDDSASMNEKNYYMGLIHFRLRELPQALEKFQFVKATKDPTMAPSAAFYEGMIFFGQEKWDDAQKSFELVLDTSTDPRMDTKAEEYIEKIAEIKAWESKKENPFTLNTMVGAMYDSNVLLAPDGVESQGSAIEGDIRAVLMGQLQYRALFEKTHEWIPQVMSYYQLSSKDEVSAADALLNNVAAPYTYKGTAFGKGYRLTARPAYEILNMDNNGDGTREVVLTSYLANIDNTFVMSKKWIASYIGEVRMDDSQLPSSTGDTDADAMRYTLRTRHINFLDDKRKKLLQSFAGLVYNSAEGIDRLYQRFEVGSTFMKPIHWWDSTWSLGLALYQLKYPDASAARTDLNSTVTTGITRPVNEWVNFGVTLSYTNNNSDVSTSQYNRYSVMTFFTTKNSF
jgi:tetratricopeptide (TPR) repeat protein